MPIQNETELIVFLAGSPGGCSLDSSPGKNWVEEEGGLPQYICKIARAVMRSGKSKSSAISIAISRTKKWAAGGDKVNADTRAKAAKAVAQWEALKAKAHGHSVVKASREDGSEFIQLSAIDSFNTDIVRNAWMDLQRAFRLQKESEDQANGVAINAPDYSPGPYSYVSELWNDHIIVENESFGGDRKYFNIPYTVENGVVEFGEPVEVVKEFVPVEQNTDDYYKLSGNEAALLADVMQLSKNGSLLQQIINLAGK